MLISGPFLRALRTASDVQLTGLAAMVGVGQSHISNIEAGRSDASPELLVAIAAALKVPVLALLEPADPGICGLAVRKLRERSGLSIKALGAATGLEPSYISNIEAGRRAGSGDAAVAIARALGADLRAIFTEPAEMAS